MRKMSTSIKRTRHGDERASSASNFCEPVFKCQQSLRKPYRRLETTFCFSRWSGRRTATASLRNRSELDAKYSIFANQFYVKSVLDFLIFILDCMTEPLL